MQVHSWIGIICLMSFCIFVLATTNLADSMIFTEVRVNSDSTPVTELPNMDFNSTCGRMIAVWDEYASPYSAWFQILDQELNKIGENSLVSDELYTTYWGDAAMAATGDFAITFRAKSSSTDTGHVYVRLFNADATPKGSSIQVVDDGILVRQGEPAIASDSLGNVVVTWLDKRNAGQRDVWVQLFSSSGVKIGTNIRVNDDLDTCCVGYVKVTRNASGQFVIAWHANAWSGDTYLYGGKDIRFQLFQADGSKIGSIRTANLSNPDTRRKEPAVSINRSGAFGVAWVATIEDALYVQFFDSDGDPIGTNLKVQRSEEPDETAISLTDGDVAVLAWEEDRPGPGMGVHYQMFQSAALNGSPEIVIDSNRYSPSVNTSSDDVYFLYEAPDMRVMAAKLSDMAFDYSCGDANGDAAINVGDAVFVINYVFRSGPFPDPLCIADANGDGSVNIGDAVYLINYVFKGGDPPIEPCCQ